LSTSFKGKISQGVKWSFIGTYGGQIVGFLISIFLARLLSPEDFGIVGMSLSVIQILKVAMSLGFSDALIQKKENSHRAYSTVFIINLSLGILITFLIYFSAPLIAQFYGRAELISIVKLLSVIYLLESLSVVQVAILKKELNFKSLSIRSLVAQLLSGTLATVLAFLGYGIYALVVHHIVINTLRTMLLWRMSNWRPKLEFSWEEARNLWGFASYSFSSIAVNKIFNASQSLIIGKVFNAEILGYFARAQSFSQLIVQNSSNSLRTLLFPALSSIQDDQERFLRGYLIVSEIVAILSVVLCSLSIINAEVLVIGLFGAKWAPVVPIFMWLMIKSIVVPNNGVIITTILAKGYAKENFNYVVIKQIIGMLPVIYLLFGDLDSFLHSLVAAGIIILAVSYFSAYKLLQISFWEQLKPLLILVGISAMILFLLQNYLTLENSVLNALVKSAIYVLCMGGFLWLNHKNIIKEAAGMVRSK